MSNAKLLLVFAPFALFALWFYKHPQVTFSLSSAKGGGLTIPTCEPDNLGKIDLSIPINKGSSNSYNWAEAAGCIARPLLETWAVSHNPNEMAAFGPNVSAIVQVVTPPPSGASHMYRVKYTMHELIPISWTLDWIHQIVQGSLTDPQEILISISKNSGSSLLRHFAGSVRLIRISPLVTLSAIRIEADAPGINSDTVGDYAKKAIEEFRSGTPYWNGLTQVHAIDFE